MNNSAQISLLDEDFFEKMDYTMTHITSMVPVPLDIMLCWALRTSRKMNIKVGKRCSISIKKHLCVYWKNSHWDEYSEEMKIHLKFEDYSSYVSMIALLHAIRNKPIKLFNISKDKEKEIRYDEIECNYKINNYFTDSKISLPHNNKITQTFEEISNLYNYECRYKICGRGSIFVNVYDIYPTSDAFTFRLDNGNEIEIVDKVIEKIGQLIIDFHDFVITIDHIEASYDYHQPDRLSMCNGKPFAFVHYTIHPSYLYYGVGGPGYYAAYNDMCERIGKKFESKKLIWNMADEKYVMK